jgi:hypothetical protein
MNYADYYSGQSQQPSSLLGIDEFRRRLAQMQQQQQMTDMPAQQMPSMGQRAGFSDMGPGWFERQRGISGGVTPGLPGPPRFSTNGQRQVYRGPRRAGVGAGTGAVGGVIRKPIGPPASPAFTLQPYGNGFPKPRPAIPRTGGGYPRERPMMIPV